MRAFFMAKLILLEIGLLFDPADAWSQTSQFETWLGKALRQSGLEGDIIRSAYGSIPVSINKPVLTGKRVFYIRKSSTAAVPTLQNQPLQGRPLGTKGMLDKFREHNVRPKERDFSKGKFLTRKGYLKKENG